MAQDATQQGMIPGVYYELRYVIANPILVCKRSHTYVGYERKQVFKGQVTAENIN